CEYDGMQKPTLLKPGAEKLCVPVPRRTGSAAPWLLTGTGRVVVSLMAFSFARFLVYRRNNQPALPAQPNKRQVSVPAPPIDFTHRLPGRKGPAYARSTRQSAPTLAPKHPR